MASQSESSGEERDSGDPGSRAYRFHPWPRQRARQLRAFAQHCCRDFEETRWLPWREVLRGRCPTKTPAIKRPLPVLTKNSWDYETSRWASGGRHCRVQGGGDGARSDERVSRREVIT